VSVRDVLTELLINRSILHLSRSVVVRRSGWLAVDGTAKCMCGGEESCYSKDLQKCSQATQCQKLSIFMTDDSGFSCVFNLHFQDARLILRIAVISYNQITESQGNMFCASIPKHNICIGSIEI